MNLLSFVFSFYLGIMPLGTFPVYEDQRVIAKSDFAGTVFTDFRLRIYLLDYFYVGGGIKSLMIPPQDPLNNASFDPYQIRNSFEAGFEGPINEHTTFVVHFTHDCIHPEISYLPTKSVRSNWEGAFEELSIGVRVDTRKK